MINFEELINALILPLVAYPKDVVVTCTSSEEDDLCYQVKVNPNDLLELSLLLLTNCFL